MSTRIGIVIPTSDRSKQLYKAIKALNHNIPNKEDFDLCIVDDGQYDLINIDIIENIWPNIKLQKTIRNGSAHAKNIGIQNVIGDWIAFIDDDCIVNMDWSRSLLKIVDSVMPDVVAIGGDVISSKPDSLISWYLKSTDHLRGPLTNNNEVVGIAGANMVIRKSALDRVNCFEENLTEHTGSEDTNLVFKLNRIGSCIFNPRFSVEHNNSIKLGNFCRKYFNYGFSLAGHVYLNKVGFRNYGVYRIPPSKKTAILYSIVYVFSQSIGRLVRTPYLENNIIWNFLFWPLTVLQEVFFQFGALVFQYKYARKKTAK